MVAVVGLASLVLTRRRDRPRVGPLAQQLVAAAAGSLLLLTPIVYVFLGNRVRFDARLGRSKRELFLYSARPLEYIVPTFNHPFFKRWTASFAVKHLHHSNLSEQTLYVGMSIIFLAVIGVAARARRSYPPQVEDSGPGRAPGFVIPVAGVLVIAALLWSAPPSAFGIPFPSDGVYLLTHFWRVYARFYLVVDVGMVLLAGFGLTALAGAWPTARATGWRGLRQLGIIAIASGIVAVDVLNEPPTLTFSYQKSTPVVYQWVRMDAPHWTVAEYPLYPAPYLRYLLDEAYQPAHGHPLFNGALPNSPNDYLQRLAGSRRPPARACAARRGRHHNSRTHLGVSRHPPEPVCNSPRSGPYVCGGRRPSLDP